MVGIDAELDPDVCHRALHSAHAKSILLTGSSVEGKQIIESREHANEVYNYVVRTITQILNYSDKLEIKANACNTT